MTIRIEFPVTVITPTIGKPTLKKAIESVRDQTYGNITHIIVADGHDYSQDLLKMDLPRDHGEKIVYTSVPFNTGSQGIGYYGHRIYAGYSHFIPGDYVFFLDEDNWFEPNHVDTLVDLLDHDRLDFAHSLRKIHDENGNYLIDDNCECLGQWPIWFTHGNPQYMVDTSTFAFRREYLEETGHLWHSGWGGDRRYFNLVRDTARYDTTKEYTMCYRLDGNPNSVKKNFFEQGNAKQLEVYNGKLPWVK